MLHQLLSSLLVGVITIVGVLLFANAVTVVQSQTTTGNSVCPTGAFDIQFQPIDVEPRSFFTAPGQTATVQRSKKMPRIIIRAIDSNGNFDPSVRQVTIRASCDDTRVTLEGGTFEARMDRGQAHFDTLTILNGENPRLNFTAFADPQQLRYENQSFYTYYEPLHLKYITTGPITVLTRPVEQFALQFLTYSSYVRYPDVPLTVVSGVALPTIRLQVLSSDYNQYRPQLGLVNNFTVGVGWVSAPPPGTTIRGNLQPIVSGFATFDDLIIETTSTAPLPGLNFYIADPYLSVHTGQLEVSPLVESARIQFDTPDKSYIFSAGQTFSGVNSVVFPKIQLSVRDNMGRLASPWSGLIITASCDRADLTEGNVAGVVEGVATFENLAFFKILHEDQRPYVLTFTAGTNERFRPQRKSDFTLYTGIIMMSLNAIPSYRFRFVPGVADAFFNGEFMKKQVVKDVLLSPPLRVELLNSDNTRNTTYDMSVTVAVANGRFSVSAASVRFNQGVASFPDFLFTTTSTIDNSYIVLSITNDNNDQDRIVTGRINVTNAVSNFDLRFQPYGAGLFSAESQPSFATIGVPMPPIVIELVTSANAIDTGSNDITITASSSGATLTGSFVRVANGVATFRELTFVSDIPGDFKLTFTAGDAGSAPVQGKSIVTGTVTTFAVITPNVRPVFRRNDSYIQYAGQSRPISLQQNMQEVIVYLATSDHTASQKVNGTAANILGEISLSNGAFRPGTRTSGLEVEDGLLTIKNLNIDSGLDPILTICFRSGITSGDPPPADGQCVSTGPLRTTSTPGLIDKMGYLAIYEPMTTVPEDGKVAKGQLLQIAVDLRDSVGDRTLANNPNDFDVEATTSVQLAGTTRVSYNKSIGVALFTDLVFREDLSAGITPAITFTVQSTTTGSSTALLGLLPISSQLLSIQGANANSGVDVVAEILTDYLTFDPQGWREKVARRLNVESARIRRLRVFRGKSADPDPNGITEDTTERLPSWSGTRFDMRFLPPLATSRDTRSAQDLADLFVNLKPSCLIGELQMRKAYFNASDVSCDWYLFDAQLTSVRSCVQSFGQPGYCQCHVPLFSFMGNRCLGLPRMTTLCLDILINENAANCQQPSIVEVCKKLQFPEAPRTALAASAAVMFLCFLPIFYLYSGGFFHKINLPTAEQSRIPQAMFVASDEQDFL